MTLTLIPSAGGSRGGQPGLRASLCWGLLARCIWGEKLGSEVEDIFLAVARNFLHLNCPLPPSGVRHTCNIFDGSLSNLFLNASDGDAVVCTGPAVR